MYGTYKDEAPIASITKMRNILGSMSIFPVESHWDSFGDANYSLILSDSGLAATNGKGISREYALASALGEFLERLQNLWLYPLEFGIMQSPKILVPDIEIKDFAEAAPFLGKFAPMYGMNPGSSRSTGLTAPFLPYWDVYGEQVTSIPLDLLTSTNGMCAGNTPEEALVEGICEVLERYVLSRLFFESAAVPTIPLEYIKNFKVYRLITDIQKKGYHVIVKDLTLNGKYPVLGVMLFNKDRTKYSVRLGSSPIFETALQRCLTEVAQNYSFSDFEYKMMDFRFEFCEAMQNQRSETNNSRLLLHYSFNNIASVGHYPTDLFSEVSPLPSFQQAFKETFRSNRDSLRFLLNLLRNQNRKVYIRDVGFLGFPAYHVYISDLSCVDPIWFSQNTEEYHKFTLRSPARALLLRLKSLKDDEIRVLADCMKEDIDSSLPFAFNVFPATRFIPRVLLKHSSTLSFRIDQIPYAVWLVPILYRLKDYSQALFYLNYVLEREKYEQENFSGFDLEGAREMLKHKLLRHTPQPDPARYLYQPMFFLLKKLSLGIPEKQAETLTAEYFGRELTDEVLDFLTLKIQGLPDCGDCSGCSLREECYFDTWKQRVAAISRRLDGTFPKQANLRQFFSDFK